MGQAVVVALAEVEAVGHGGGVGGVGPADVDPPVPEDLLESLGHRGLPHGRCLVPPEAQLGLHGGSEERRGDKHFRRDEIKDWDWSENNNIKAGVCDMCGVT